VSPGDHVYRINTGSSVPTIGNSGRIWQADIFFNTGLVFAASSGTSVATTQDRNAAAQAIYLTERYHTFSEVGPEWLKVTEAG